MTQPA
jgi:hypothetical protein